MSTRPVEPLIDAVAEVDPWAELVEEHLDAHPLPVDEAEIARIATRLEARIAPASPSWRRPLLVGAGLLVLAAAAALVLRDATRTERVEGSGQPQVQRLELVEPPPLVRELNEPGTVFFEGPSRSLELAPDSVALTSEQGAVAVVLVQQGEASSDGVPIPEGHWGVLTRKDGIPHQVVFPDGQAPPLDAAVWEGSTARDQLRALRWQVMPDRTLETLDRLLEEE